MRKIFIFLSVLLLTIALNQRSNAQVTTGQEEQARNDTVMAHLKKAQSLAQQGNTEEASKIYISIMESDPNNREAVQGWLFANMNSIPKEEDAIIVLDSLGNLYPANTGIIFFKAYLEAEHKHYEEALKDAETLIKLQPDDALNYIIQGQVLMELEKYEEAFIALDRATSLDPKRPDVWEMKAFAFVGLSKFEDAIDAINKGVELIPNNPGTIYNRACIYSLKGDKINALADLEKAISMNPSYKEYARQDKDFKSLYNDEDFKKLTQ